MKSYNIDDRLLDKDLIRQAIVTTCKNKKRHRNGSDAKWLQAQRILKDVDRHAEIIYEQVLAFNEVDKAKEQGLSVDPEVEERAYSPKRCEPFELRDTPSGKNRIITSVPLFPDQMIHQLLILASRDVLMKGMYAHSYGSIPGGGIHKGKRYLNRVIKESLHHDKAAIKYFAKLDVKKCYPSICHEVLKAKLKQKFRGKLFRSLAFAVIDSYEEAPGKGLPIGYATSQWFCNFLLTPLDHYIKQELGIKHYVRYMDDMVLAGRNKKKLHKAVFAISNYLDEIGLTLKENHQVFRFDYVDRKGKHRGRDLDFLGFRFFRNKTIMRKRIALSIMRQVRKIKKMKKRDAHQIMSLMSRLGWLRHCNSYNFYMRNVKPFIRIGKLKEVLRDESRKYSNAHQSV